MMVVALVFAVAVTIYNIAVTMYLLPATPGSCLLSNDIDAASFVRYKGPTYWKEGVTIARQVLFDTEQLGLSYHSVLFERNEQLITGNVCTCFVGKCPVVIWI